MPTREEIMRFIAAELAKLVNTPADIWTALYVLLLDYVHGVPRITDANRLMPGSIWHRRAKVVEATLAQSLMCDVGDVPYRVDQFMRKVYPPGVQRMNPIGIALACAAIYLIDRFAGRYRWKAEAIISVDVFPNLINFRRRAVDIVVFHAVTDVPFAVISSKWGMRHDRLRDPQEEADTYKLQEPGLRFFVLTNEFDNGRLQHLLNYPTIDGVFHINKDLVWEAYGGTPAELAGLKDLTDLFLLFP